MISEICISKIIHGIPLKISVLSTSQPLITVIVRITFGVAKCTQGRPMSDTTRQTIVEAITLDEAAVRCRVTRETFQTHYDGPVVSIGRERRVMIEHFDDWLKRSAGIATRTDDNKPWGAFDDVG